MKEKARKIVKIMFGTSSNIHMKAMITCLCLGIIFFLLSIMVTEEVNYQANMMLVYLGGLSFAIFLIGIKGADGSTSIICELSRFILFLPGLVFSLNFFVNVFPYIVGVRAIAITLISTVVLAASLFYWISKCIDIFKAFKKLLIELKSSLFNFNYDVENKDTPMHKAQAFIENITTFLMTLVGFGVAINSIVKPLLETISKFTK